MGVGKSFLNSVRLAALPDSPSAHSYVYPAVHLGVAAQVDQLVISALAFIFRRDASIKCYFLSTLSSLGTATYL
jgi:hypothetical protein